MIDKYNEVGISALEYIETANMVMTGNATAKPAEECAYPCCEDCINYHGHWCTVPIVVSKQNYILINDKIDDLMKRVLDLENLVYEEIWGIKNEVLDV